MATTGLHSEETTTDAAIFRTGGTLREVVIPIYHETSRERLATIQAARIFKDYETRGFLKIGALPKLVFEDVQVEVQSPALLAEFMDYLKAEVQRGKRARRIPLEIRNVQVLVRGETSPRYVFKQVTTSSSGIIQGLEIFRASQP